MPTSKPEVPNSAPGGDDPSSYKAKIDAGFNAQARLGWAFAPHAQATPNMTVALAAGALLQGTTLTEVAAQSTGSITAPVTHPRVDRVVIDRATGAASVVAGTEAASPSAPAIPSGKLPVARVALTVGMTAITNAAITDDRVAGGSVVIGSISEPSETEVPSTQEVAETIAAIPRADTLARDNAAMNAFLSWLSASRASGPVPGGYEWTFKSDEWNKTAAVYDADGDFYSNYSTQNLTHTLDTTYGGFSSAYTIVQKIPASALTVNGASVNVTFAAQPGGTLQIIDAFIGHAATSGDAYDFAATPTRLTFSGSNGVTTATGGTATSDTATFALDETKDLLVAININTATLKAVATASGYAIYWKVGAEAATVNKTGYTLASTYAIACVSALTVNSAVTNMSIHGFASLGYTPTTATIYLLHQAVDAVTLNTDIKVASSRISGWANATDLATLCTYDSTYKLLKATVNLSALGSGTYGYAKVETFNNKRQKVRAALAWFE